MQFSVSFLAIALPFVLALPAPAPAKNADAKADLLGLPIPPIPIIGPILDGLPLNGLPLPLPTGGLPNLPLPTGGLPTGGLPNLPLPTGSLPSLPLPTGTLPIPTVISTLPIPTGVVPALPLPSGLLNGLPLGVLSPILVNLVNGALAILSNILTGFQSVGTVLPVGTVSGIQNSIASLTTVKTTLTST